MLSAFLPVASQHKSTAIIFDQRSRHRTRSPTGESTSRWSVLHVHPMCVSELYTLVCEYVALGIQSRLESERTEAYLTLARLMRAPLETLQSLCVCSGMTYSFYPLTRRHAALQRRFKCHPNGSSSMVEVSVARASEVDCVTNRCPFQAQYRAYAGLVTSIRFRNLIENDWGLGFLPPRFDTHMTSTLSSPPFHPKLQHLEIPVVCNALLIECLEPFLRAPLQHLVTRLIADHAASAPDHEKAMTSLLHTVALKCTSVRTWISTSPNVYDVPSPAAAVNFFPSLARIHTLALKVHASAIQGLLLALAEPSSFVRSLELNLGPAPLTVEDWDLQHIVIRPIHALETLVMWMGI